MFHMARSPFPLCLVHGTFAPVALTGVHNPLQCSKADFEALAHIADRRARVYNAMIRALDRSMGSVTQTLTQERACMLARTEAWRAWQAVPPARSGTAWPRGGHGGSVHGGQWRRKLHRDRRN